MKEQLAKGKSKFILCKQILELNDLAAALGVNIQGEDGSGVNSYCYIFR